MVGEALLAYNHRNEAVDLISRIMQAIIENLKREQSFRSHYHAVEPKAAGQRNALVGLPPIGLFLETLGVRPITPWKVEISNQNPFPWPVKVQYRGMQVVSTDREVTVIFPDGEEVTVDKQIPCMLEHSITSQDR
jgi:hypothetical protein